MPNPIPPASRLTVETRDNHQCQRCGSRGSEWHHRRSRRVRDLHTHCPCNGVLLCQTCHAWAHANPLAARRAGLIVSMHQPLPGDVPLDVRGTRFTLLCDGGYNVTPG